MTNDHLIYSLVGCGFGMCVSSFAIMVDRTLEAMHFSAHIREFDELKSAKQAQIDVARRGLADPRGYGGVSLYDDAGDKVDIPGDYPMPIHEQVDARIEIAREAEEE